MFFIHSFCVCVLSFETKVVRSGLVHIAHLKHQTTLEAKNIPTNKEPENNIRNISLVSGN